MEERRKFLRFPLQLDARYSEQNEENWKECSVVDISREGMGIIIHSIEAIREGTLLQVEIDAPMQEDSIMVAGELVWVQEIKGDPRFNYAGGVQLTSISPENKWRLMDYAYEGWNKGEKK